MYVSRHVSVCRFTHFGPYLIHIEISKTSYNSERREYYLISTDVMFDDTVQTCLVFLAGDQLI
jgi:hypothetical protein